eukprot:Selendium_serpulae@DN5953_c1_g2_i1.p1
MGGEQSTEVDVDQKALQGFNERETRERRRRRRDAQQRKEERRRAKPRDEFFERVDVTDTIKPIFVEEAEERRKEEEPVGQVEIIQDVISKYKPKRESSEEALSFDEPLSSSSASDSEGDFDRGVFHKEADLADKEQSIFDPTAHVISVEGEVSAGSALKFKDLSVWKHTYPVHQISWFLGSELGLQDRFTPLPVGEGRRFVVPESAVGRYIQVKAVRRIEDQLKRTALRDVDGGVFDPHVKAARHLNKGQSATYKDVTSMVVAGPVLIADSSAHMVLQSLSRGGFDCAVMMRDEPLTDEWSSGCNLDKVDGGGKAARIKLPGGCHIGLDAVRFVYVPPLRPKAVKSASKTPTVLRAAVWRRHVTKSMREEREQDDAEPDERTASFKLKEVVFRPSKSKKIIIMSLAESPDRQGDNTRHDLIRFDVDPAVGRDSLLSVLLGFQAAAATKRVRPDYWLKCSQNGDVDKAKFLVRDFIQGLSEKTVHEQAGYFVEPVTPWEYAKKTEPAYMTKPVL